MSRHLPRLLTALALLGAYSAHAGDAPSKPAPSSDSEPLAERFSLLRGAQFLDTVSVDWTRARKCGTCHTNYAHMMARPTVKGAPSPELAEVRAFFEGRAANWDRPEPGSKPIAGGEVIAVGAALAFHDAATTGKLHPLTRASLDRMWTIQRPDGTWEWFDCDYPPLEDDDYYGTALAAIAVGHAPDDYKSSESARLGLAKLVGYLRATPAPNLHHRAMLLWAATGLDGLLTPADHAATIRDLLAAQRPDGGWSLPSLGRWTRRDGTPNSLDAPSDGYGTGYVIYVLRQAGIPADDPAIRKGITWLKSNQRASGRWFTRSVTLDQIHYITHAGTGFALMALTACGEQ
jgi:squalene-hopene/tetraprenyl-beta-curcumene cyclase